MSLRKQWIRLLVLLIVIIAAPIVTAIMVFTNLSPNPSVTGANLGILIKVSIGSGVAFGYWKRSLRKYDRERALAELQELMDMPAEIIEEK